MTEKGERKERESTRLQAAERRGGGSQRLWVGAPEAGVGLPGRGSGLEHGRGPAGQGEGAGTPEGAPLGAPEDLRRGQPGRTAGPLLRPRSGGSGRPGPGAFVSAPGGRESRVRSRVCGGGGVCAPGCARVCASVSAQEGGSAR